MLTNVYDLLEKLRTGLTKPDARIIVISVYDTKMGDEDGIKFQFIWYDESLSSKYLKLSILIEKDMIESIQDENSMVDHIIRLANLELEKQYQEMEKSQ